MNSYVRSTRNSVNFQFSLKTKKILQCKKWSNPRKKITQYKILDRQEKNVGESENIHHPQNLPTPKEISKNSKKNSKKFQKIFKKFSKNK